MSSPLKTGILLACVLGFSCARRAEPQAKASALTTPLSSKFPASTKLRIGDPQVQLCLSLSGERVPFDVEWHELSGGPKTIEAFRAHALDGSVVGDTPPIHAASTGLNIKIIGVQMRNRAAMRLAVAPGSTVRSLADLKGKKIAYSPGQAQGALVLRTLKKAHISTRDVTLVELESDAFKDALSSRQVDVAPIGGPGLARYLKEYGGDGAHAIDHGVRDNLAFFYVTTETLADADRAAALRAYVALRMRSQLWIYEHPERWVDAYYVKSQGLSRAAGLRVIEEIGRPQFPGDWSEAIALTQETIDLLATESGRPGFDANGLFDRRFESVAAEVTAAAESARTGAP
ncbi:MAG: ABC-type transporter substrate-binding protein [Myxococcaceae bacterium]|nr:ABC-type transporter substrate-binding protein [Myxococcaceae bacterium]